MDMNEYAAWACSMDLQHEYAAWTYSLDMKLGYAV
jgi:hypothetical protein